MNDLLRHFGLSGEPYAPTPDPRFAYATAQHKSALKIINYSVQSQRGLCLLQGSPGTGKTTLARLCEMSWENSENIKAAHLNAPSTRSQAGFLREVLKAFDIEPTRNLTGLMDRFKLFLAEQYNAKKIPVLLLDDAQLASTGSLDLLHALSNEQTLRENLLQVIILAQPDIDHKLDQKPALKSRITGGAYLGPLSFEDAEDMLRHRMHLVGGNYDAVFEKSATELMYQITQGICRDLCICAHQAMVTAYADDQATISAQTIGTVSQNMRFKGWQIK